MSKLAQVRQGDQHGGNSSGSVHFWQRKLLNLYDSRAVLGFVQCNHWAAVTDGSVHSCKDTLLTALYNSQDNIACWATCQHIWPSKLVQPGEHDLAEEVERELARREGERISSYKVLQALSKQLWLISRKQLSLHDFKLPAEMETAVQPLCPGDQRRLGNDGVLHVVRKSGETCEVDLLGALQAARTLTVISDQGPVMLSAMSFIQNKLFLIHTSYDKYHRLIRDCKLAAEHSGVLQATLAAQHLWGINYGPFGSGSFWEEKKAALAHFFATESPVTWLMEYL